MALSEIDFEVLSDNDIWFYSSRLARDVKSSTTFKPFNRILGIREGAAGFLSEFLGIFNRLKPQRYRIESEDIDYMKIRSYKRPGVKGDLRMLAEPKTIGRGDNVLILDDIVDSSDTMTKAVNYVRELGCQCMTAALVLKPHADEKPDFHSYATEAWAIFPWEYDEMAEQLIKEIDECEDKQIARRLYGVIDKMARNKGLQITEFFTDEDFDKVSQILS